MKPLVSLDLCCSGMPSNRTNALFGGMPTYRLDLCCSGMPSNLHLKLKKVMIY